MGKKNLPANLGLQTEFYQKTVRTAKIPFWQFAQKIAVFFYTYTK